MSRFLKGRPGLVTPDITVFDDPEAGGIMYLDKPVEVKVDAETKTIYLWIKDPEYGISVGEEHPYLKDGPGTLPPWPGEPERWKV